MISLDQILAAYPENLRAFKESILKEYLQVKILNSIFNSVHANKLAFLGGTALRIVHGSTRFSEDLDFDNFALTETEFINLSTIIQKDLMLEGLEVKVNTVTKNAYRIKIRIPNLLFDSGLSTMSEHKILIQVDTVPQNFDYVPEKPLLNKFDVFTQINAVPKDLLLAQKIFASVNRKRIMGRDFFDIVFLYGLGAKPDFAYLKKNIGVDNPLDLKKYLLEKTASLDFEDLARDVEPFLFDPRDKKKVLLFREFIETLCVTNLSDLGAGILKGYGLERPKAVRVFVPFPEGTTLEAAQGIEQKLNPEPLEHFHIEAINGRFYLHVQPDEDFSKYLKLKGKLSADLN